MSNIDLAIIIPTLNEEKYIGKLLDSIAAQSVLPSELVIVDANSQDKTIDKIKKRQKLLPQLKYYQIPKSTISRQRNFGANKTTSENILFLDADIVLKDNKSLEKYIENIRITKPDIAVVPILPLSNYWKDKIFFQFSNIAMRILRKIWPAATGMNLYVARSIFNKVKGFDEEIRIGEDIELVQRIVKIGGKFMIFKQPKVYTSVRRFQKERRRSFTLKMAKAFYYVNTRGFKNNPIDYELGKH